MRQAKYAWALLALAAIAVQAQDATIAGRQVHQAPDKDGVYYAGPEVTAPRLLSTVYVPYPSGVPAKVIPGMTVLSMVIDSSGIPAHIQVLHTHGEAFDRAAIAAVEQSKFEAGQLRARPCLYGLTCGLSSVPTAAKPFLNSSSPKGICLPRVKRNWRTSIITRSRIRRPSPFTPLTRTLRTRFQRIPMFRWRSSRSWSASRAFQKRLEAVS